MEQIVLKNALMRLMDEYADSGHSVTELVTEWYNTPREHTHDWAGWTTMAISFRVAALKVPVHVMMRTCWAKGCDVVQVHISEQAYELGSQTVAIDHTNLTPKSESQHTDNSKPIEL